MKSVNAAHQLSAAAASRAIADGKLTCEALTASCLERIAAREGEVQAWACVDPAQALAAARAIDKLPRRSRIHGIPVGIKDVIDTHDMPTEYGSPIYKGNVPACDAACVAQIRELGGLILGKTVSTEFATRHPNKTRHPLNPLRSPGGSSSGSAAAVADFMVPVALGTQTSSSIIRPAAYCGVVGFKPSFGLINRAGLKFLAESLDTIGILARTVPDAALILEELTGLPPMRFGGNGNTRPRVGLCRTPWWGEADEATRENLERAAHKLAAAGALVTELVLDPGFGELNRIQTEISSYEFFRALSFERTRHPELISASLTSRIAAGGKITRDQYAAGCAAADRGRAQIADAFRDYDVLLAPSTRGEAPTIDSTGDPTFGLLWTLLRLPCLTVPFGHGPLGLPLGVQLIGAADRDRSLLAHAEWSRQVLQA